MKRLQHVILTWTLLEVACFHFGYTLPLPSQTAGRIGIVGIVGTDRDCWEKVLETSFQLVAGVPKDLRTWMNAVTRAKQTIVGGQCCVANPPAHQIHCRLQHPPLVGADGRKSSSRRNVRMALSSPHGVLTGGLGITTPCLKLLEHILPLFPPGILLVLERIRYAPYHSVSSASVHSHSGPINAMNLLQKPSSRVLDNTHGRHAFHCAVRKFSHIVVGGLVVFHRCVFLSTGNHHHTRSY